MKKLGVVLLVVLVAFSGSIITYSKAGATAPNNNLIDDSIFDDTNTMNASQIDSFLNTFSGSCISTNSGFSASEPTGYTPTSSSFFGRYSYGAPVSAGKVIYDVAVGHQINPQVLLTKLQNEEGLVRGDGPYGCGATAITASVGYACTDSGTFSHDYSYTGADPYSDSSALVTPLYYRNGTPVNSVSGNCVNSNLDAGFSEQVVHAAWLLSFSRHRSEGQNTWAAVSGSWNHCDDNNTCPANMNIPSSWACYSGLMTQGSFKRCSDDTTAVFYDGYTTIDGAAVHMDTGATAALYVYTPHIQSFTSIFSGFFGSPYSNCSYPGGAVGTVYRLFNPNTNGTLLSTDPFEVCTATGQMGYIMDSSLLFTSGAGSTPVYRLQKNGAYLFTISAAERDSAVSNYGYSLEGVAFNASATLDSVNAPMPVYRLSYPPTGMFYYTISSSEADNLVSTMGFKLNGVAFYSQNTTGVTYPNPVYRLAGPTGGYLYTSSIDESNNAVSNYGYRFEGTAYQTRLGYTTDDLPIYRLAGGKGYFYTSNLGERKAAIALGYRSEGVGFFGYASDNLSATKPVFRLVGKDGTYFYTSTSSEVSSAVSNFGYKLEGTAYRIP